MQGPDKPVLLFTRPADPDKLTAAGIVQPPDPPIDSGSMAHPYRFRGRIGRGEDALSLTDGTPFSKLH